MQWESWSQFWHMGGAAVFVWGSYAVTFGLVVLELVLVAQRRKETLKRLLRWRRALGKDGSGRQSAPLESEQ
ncbi:heme exporter protein CcmD [Azoarcus communis]|uniref:Heme exporter protein D n=1 Tax=Parazoarcus communis SWub3 = DSM 12120 TaxID=1121029 RepID=A0A323UVG5_9RHOO|nr:heme exporter protein CcmD [Parazoarcus communis]NMG50099.1 heme exporter protein CcmD [Parazoarcus communis]NMG70909.1 heme exporter protein CcmD [Parazoarcus communis SWub3 = DSM 12120]PZA16201.1 heme exporter protein CcmD [Azoarcus communis] [Parazoarcus communis SWub3 = DSM 12120]